VTSSLFGYDDVITFVTDVVLEPSKFSEQVRIYAEYNCVYSGKKLDCEKMPDEKIVFDLQNPWDFLEVVKINKNPQIIKIKDEIFAKDLKLHTLNFDENSILKIPFGLPVNLEKLSMRKNRLEMIEARNLEDFKKMKNLSEIDFSENFFLQIYDFQLKNFENLKSFLIVKNPFVCNCELYSFQRWLKSTNFEKFSPNCFKPENKKDKLLVNLKELQNCVPVQCTSKLYCPIIKCFENPKKLEIPKSFYWTEIDLRNLKIKNLNQINLTQNNFSIIRLSQNYLTSIQFEKMPRSLEELYLDHNHISNLPKIDGILEDFPNLKFLDLSFNRIRTIPRDWLFMVQFSYFVGNPLVCNCDLVPFHTWILSHNQSEDSEFFKESVRCEKPLKLQNKKLKDLLKDDICEKSKLKIILMSVIIPASFIFIFVAFTTFFVHQRISKKERNQIIEGFKDLLQQIPEKDPETGIFKDYKYDAFISYSKQDEKFTQKMINEMESNRGRNFCFDLRDFIPGVDLAENIVNFISQSNRIIIVISKNFYKSPWCKYEIQMALADMHNRRRGKFLIPILLQDVTKDENVKGNLKTILSVISALHVNSNENLNEFYDKLDSVLP